MEVNFGLDLVEGDKVVGVAEDFVDEAIFLGLDAIQEPVAAEHFFYLFAAVA